MLVKHFLWWCLEAFCECFLSLLNFSNNRLVFESSSFTSLNIYFFINNSLYWLYYFFSHNLSSWNHDRNSSIFAFRINNWFINLLLSINWSAYLCLSNNWSFYNSLFYQRLRNNSSSNYRLRNDLCLHFRSGNNFLCLSNLRFTHESLSSGHHFRVTLDFSNELRLRSVNKFWNLLIILLILRKAQRK